MVNAILVPLDGSSYSTQAVPYAIALAERTHATLHLVHVHDTSGAAEMNKLTAGTRVHAEQLVDEQRIAEEAFLAIQQRQIAQTSSVVVTKEVLDGPVASALTAYMDAATIDMVVVSRHNHGQFVRSWLGSVAVGMVRRDVMPVLVVHAADHGDVPADAAWQRIVVLLDGSALAEQAIPPALALACPHQSTITLLRVIEPTRRWDDVLPPSVALAADAMTHTRQEQATAYLHSVARRIEAAGFSASVQVIVSEYPAAAILKETQDYALVALCSHGESGWKRLALGGVADILMHERHRPLVMVRPVEIAHAAVISH